jgi:colanic acid/amylovoran biosynthesis glycosyltransferase
LRDRGCTAHLHVAGDGPMGPQIRDQVRRLGLDRMVTLHGPLSQDAVQDLVRRAAVLAAPCVIARSGDRDGLPTVLLEAMAMGTPVVATPVTGIPELVRDLDTGLLAPEGDPFALADRIARLLDDPELRLDLAEAGRRLVERQFDVDVQAGQLRALRSGSAVAADLLSPAVCAVASNGRTEVG